MNPRTSALITIILLAAAFRLMQLVPNVSPIAATALFAGAYFADKRLAFVVPLIAMLLSDLVLGLHTSMLYVYTGMAITVLIGMKLTTTPTAKATLIGALSASVIFFLLTNFGAWVSHDMYAADMSGLIAAYTAGIPFYRNSLLGDLLFVALLFGGFELLKQRFNTLRLSNQH
ncbi:MAG: hypothetical protein JKY93_05185 [Gammaproteobacteria bacterium]|nr:hypothetical protein [Gammaproteobacteria bacterium]